MILWYSSLWCWNTDSMFTNVKDISVFDWKDLLECRQRRRLNCELSNYFSRPKKDVCKFLGFNSERFRGNKGASHWVIGVSSSNCCDFITTSRQWPTVTIQSHVASPVNIMYKYLYSRQVTKSWNIKSAIKYIPQYPPCMKFNVTPNNGTQENPVPTQMHIYEKNFLSIFITVKS